MTPSDKPFITIISDGACRGNPGPGGWGTIVRKEEAEDELSGSLPRTTNNRMELTGVLEGLKTIHAPSRIHVITDSQYVVKGMTEWVAGWRRRNWRKADKKPVLNVDLWKALLQACAGHEITWEWVRGHNGHPDNERCDALANRAIDLAAG